MSQLELAQPLVWLPRHVIWGLGKCRIYGVGGSWPPNCGLLGLVHSDL